MRAQWRDAGFKGSIGIVLHELVLKGMHMTGIKHSRDGEGRLIRDRSGEDFLDVFSQELFGRQERSTCCRRDELENRTVTVEFEDHVGDGIQQCPRARLAEEQGLLCGLKGGNVKLSTP